MRATLNANRNNRLFFAYYSTTAVEQRQALSTTIIRIIRNSDLFILLSELKLSLGFFFKSKNKRYSATRHPAPSIAPLKNSDSTVATQAHIDHANTRTEKKNKKRAHTTISSRVVRSLLGSLKFPTKQMHT